MKHMVFLSVFVRCEGLNGPHCFVQNLNQSNDFVEKLHLVSFLAGAFITLCTSIINLGIRILSQFFLQYSKFIKKKTNLIVNKVKKVDLIVNFKIQNSILIASLSKKTKKRTLSLLAADIILHKDAVKMVVWKTEAIHHVYVVTMKYNQWAICAKMVRPRHLLWP